MLLDPSKFIPATFAPLANTILLTVITTIFGIGTKYGLKILGKGVSDLNTKIDALQLVQAHQAGNCLTTIQANTTQTNVLIAALTNKVDTAFGSLAKEQADTNGCLRTVVEILAKKI